MKSIIEDVYANGYCVRVANTVFKDRVGYLPIRRVEHSKPAGKLQKKSEVEVWFEGGFDPVLKLPYLTQRTRDTLRTAVESDGEATTAIVESSGRNIIRLWVNNHEVVAKKADYLEFLDSKHLAHDLHDHGILATGDFVRGFLLASTCEGKPVLSIRDYLEAPMASAFAEEADLKDALGELDRI